jgi:cysteine desulfurase/selenocysteine lyase
VSARISASVRFLAAGLGALGFEPAVAPDSPHASGILTVTHPTADASRLFHRLAERRVTVSLRHDRAGRAFLRWSPHLYNTEAELACAIEYVRQAM